ncbi:YkvA family protein [Deinococcus sp. Marseille-Q6407]|uniref:YkvA family protein n=1 Tax=Deinococcus sp. Marseille-Q6407 TaxID=2969223 RepID=UPI0021BF5E7E|nr:YkvA family protein [Deinococcus sp. Marseille-Q6407]
MIERLKAWARRLKRELLALYLAYRGPHTPWYARIWAALVLAYALSPLDLIPDFIPVLGLLDDAVLLPLGIWVAVRLIPPAVMAAARQEALTREGERLPVSLPGAAVIALLWAAALWWALQAFWPASSWPGR